VISSLHTDNRSQTSLLRLLSRKIIPSLANNSEMQTTHRQLFPDFTPSASLPKSLPAGNSGNYSESSASHTARKADARNHDLVGWECGKTSQSCGLRASGDCITYRHESRKVNLTNSCKACDTLGGNKLTSSLSESEGWKIRSSETGTSNQ